jgi:Trp operon repressor
MRLKNRLWNPEHPEAKRSKQPAIFKDALCQDCVYIGRCDKGPCFWMKHINGNTPSKEALMSDINTKDMEYRDYKDDLNEMMEHRQHRIDSSLKIPIVKHKAISILLLAGITQKDISNLFCMSIKQINRISIKIKTLNP